MIRSAFTPPELSRTKIQEVQNAWRSSAICAERVGTLRLPPDVKCDHKIPQDSREHCGEVRPGL